MKLKTLTSAFILCLLMENAAVIAMKTEEEESKPPVLRASQPPSEVKKSLEEVQHLEEKEGPEFFVTEKQPFTLRRSPGVFNEATKDTTTDVWHVITDKTHSSHLLESSPFPTTGISKIEIFASFDIKQGGIKVGMVGKDNEWLIDDRGPNAYHECEYLGPITGALEYEIPQENSGMWINFLITNHPPKGEISEFEVLNVTYRTTSRKPVVVAESERDSLWEEAVDSGSESEHDNELWVIIPRVLSEDPPSTKESPQVHEESSSGYWSWL